MNSAVQGDHLMRFFVRVLLLIVCSIPACSGYAAEKPRVRTITAFVRLDRAHYHNQIQETLAMLGRAKAEYEKKGYEVLYTRITTQPFPEYIHGLNKQEALEFFKSMEALLPKKQFMASIGPAMVSDSDSLFGVELLKEALPNSEVFYASNVVASERGIHWRAVHASADLIKHLADHSKQSEANFGFAASAMVPLYTPFYPVSYHTGAGHKFAVGISSANAVKDAFQNAKGNRETARILLQRSLNEHASRIQEISKTVEQITGWEYMGLDTSVAPSFPGTNESVGAAIEDLTGVKFGSSGTLTAAALITEIIKAIPVKQVGYSGLMLPILEDEVLARRWSEGKITADIVLAYSAICGTGLDTIPLPGDISTEQLERMIGDMAVLAFKLRKPLAARLMPIAGKKAGQSTEFDWLLKVTLQPLP
jgi:uncharacterized protein (UPF0210 family)